MDNILSVLSTIVLGIVAIAGIALNYLKEKRESKRDNSSDLRADYERRTLLLEESNKKCAGLEEKIASLEDEVSRLNREKMELLAELVRKK